MNIRPATENDWPEISGISNISGYFDYISEMGKSYMNTGTILVAEESRVVGFLKIEDLCDNSIWLSGLRVHPDYRRLGIASLLTNKAIESERSRGFSAARILVSSDNKASLALSQKAGFTIISHLEFYEGTPTCPESKPIQPAKGSMVNFGWKFGYYTDERHCRIEFRECSGISYTMSPENEEGYPYSHILSGTGDISLDGKGFTSVETALSKEINVKGKLMEEFENAFLLEIKI